MLRVIGLPLTLLLLAGLAHAQEIAAAAASPYDLAKFVETHADFDCAPLWEAFHTNDVFLPHCEENFNGVASCTAELISLAGSPDVVFRLENRSSHFQAFLRYRRVGRGSQIAGAFAPGVKYFRPQHRFERFGLKPFLVVTGQGASGTGISTKIEYWIDLTREGLEPVFDFISEGHYSPLGAGIEREFGGHVVSLVTQPVERITVGFYVKFQSIQIDGNETLLARRLDKAVYARASSGDFELDEAHSTVTADELDRFYDISEAEVSGKLSADAFLKFNFQELSAVAKGGNKDKERFAWLSNFLKQNPDSREAAKLKALMATRH